VLIATWANKAMLASRNKNINAMTFFMAGELIVNYVTI